ncbi:MAG: hypothetical protein OXT09_29550 [Myxococcales bacterium]|nr:hypothetical protein [Myxococcales bacterium]
MGRGACAWGWLLVVAACGGARGEGTMAPSSAPRAQPGIEVIDEIDATPRGGDGAPQLTLAFRRADGERVPIAPRATAWAPFRDGVALVDLERRVLLVTPDGAERVLARRSGAPPVQGPHGELIYVSVHDLVVELHVLDVSGRDRIVASGLSSAGVLAPLPDGRVLFVGADNGGVAGLWIAQAGRDARCLTNCELRTGQPWGEQHVPLPTGADAIEVRGERVAWVAADGTRHSADLSAVGGGLPTLDTETGAVVAPIGGDGP